MNYTKHYNLLITTRQHLNRKKGNDQPYEMHHIVPRCMGGTNHKENLVLLTPREHYVAHWLLYKSSVGKLRAKLAYAFFKMCCNNNNQRRTVTSRMFDTARKAIAVSCRGENSPWFNRKHTPESKQRLREQRLGSKNGMFGVEPWNKGKTKETDHALREKSLRWQEKRARGEYTHLDHPREWSEESREKISRLFKGKPKSEEHKRKLSLSQTGRKRDPEAVRRSADKRRGIKQPIVKCPHCNKEGNRSAMYRWHFDACKQKT